MSCGCTDSSAQSPHSSSQPATLWQPLGGMPCCTAFPGEDGPRAQVSRGWKQARGAWVGIPESQVPRAWFQKECAGSGQVGPLSPGGRLGPGPGQGPRQPETHLCSTTASPLPPNLNPPSHSQGLWPYRPSQNQEHIHKRPCPARGQSLLAGPSRKLPILVASLKRVIILRASPGVSIRAMGRHLGKIPIKARCHPQDSDSIGP